MAKRKKRLDDDPRFDDFILLIAVAMIAVLMLAGLPTHAYSAEAGPSVFNELKENHSMEFYDVNEGAWYYDAVMYVADRGVLIGDPDGYFLPGNAMTASMTICAFGRMEGMLPTYRSNSSRMTRQEFCWAMYWYLTAYKGYKMQESGELFPDDDSINGLYKQAVYAMREAGIVCGYEDGAFRPERTVTRAEAASMIMRMCLWEENMSEQTNERR